MSELPRGCAHPAPLANVAAPRASSPTQVKELPDALPFGRAAAGEAVLCPRGSSVRAFQLPPAEGQHGHSRGTSPHEAPARPLGENLQGKPRSPLRGRSLGRRMIHWQILLEQHLPARYHLLCPSAP